MLPVLIGLAACGKSPTPPDPIPDAPTLSCPASISVTSPNGGPVPVTFTVPTAVGGKLPVPVTCSQQPGAAFPLGSTIVTCSATDALARQASCNFAVTVAAIPRISKTKFLAIGDSITFGRCGPKPGFCPPYTTRLLELLRDRYTQQSFVVTNVGIPGEYATDGEGRLAGELSTYNPEVLLIMEGTNDMLADPVRNEAAAIESLGDMIRIARDRGVSSVFLATIPPVAPGGTYNSISPFIAPFNDKVRAVAAQMGVPLVDVFAALNADLPRYYMGDDVHPTGEALRLIGDLFYAAIRTALDNTPTDGSPAYSPVFSPTSLPGPPSLIQPPIRRRR